MRPVPKTMHHKGELRRLIREAYETSDAVDRYDLRSEDEASVIAFGQLVLAEATALANLIRLIRGA